MQQMVNETPFYALLSRMRYISRWGLMRSSIPENIQEHSHEAAVYAHALGIIRRDVFGAPCDPEHLAVLALYHDISEILTGDLPTPIKYHDGRGQALRSGKVHRGAEGGQPGIPLRRGADPHCPGRHGAAGGGLVHGALSPGL